MCRASCPLKRAAVLGILLFPAAFPTTLPQLSFEELTDRSDLVVSGTVNRTWSAWDANHKYIWTHHVIAVSGRLKGAASSTVEVAEPGGVVEGTGMTIAGSVRYQPGENVVIFAQKMPNGFLRTTGWGQGKYTVDKKGSLHADSALRDTDLTNTLPSVGQTTPLRTLDGMNLRDFAARVSNRVQAVRTNRSAQ